MNNILISSPNNGGLSILNKNGITYIDDFDTVGIYFYDKKVFRCLQLEPLILVVYEENKITSFIYNEIKDVHDVLCFNNIMYIVSTGTNEIFEISLINYKIIKSHKFNGNGDAWHLNCLCVIQNIVYVSAFCDFQEHYDYKGKTKGKGFLINLLTSEIIINNLSQPHSPKIIDNSLFICNSEEKKLVIKDLLTSEIREIEFENYTRGIDCDDKCIYLGLSSSRNIHQDYKFSTIVILDKETLEILNKVKIKHDEIYSICVLSKEWDTSILFQKINMNINDVDIDLEINKESNIIETQRVIIEQKENYIQEQRESIESQRVIIEQKENYIQEQRESIESQRVIIEQKENYIQEQRESIESQRVIIEQKENYIQEQRESIESQRVIIEQKENYIQEQRESIESQRVIIEQKENYIQEQRESIESQRVIIEQKENYIQEQRESIESQRVIIEQKENYIQELDEKISRLENTWIFKFCNKIKLIKV